MQLVFGIFNDGAGIDVIPPAVTLYSDKKTKEFTVPSWSNETTIKVQ